MAIISTLNKLGSLSRVVLKTCILNRHPNVLPAFRKMGGGGDDDRIMNITPSRFSYTKTKDQLHFYFFIGIVPLTVLVFFVNVFVGPATLSDIPEGYEPEEHEYHQHPIKRFFVKYFHEHPQIGYEKNIHHLWEVEEKNKWRETIDKVNKLMSERDDYKSWYFLPSDRGKIARKTREFANDMAEISGHR